MDKTKARKEMKHKETKEKIKLFLIGESEESISLVDQVAELNIFWGWCDKLFFDDVGRNLGMISKYDSLYFALIYTVIMIQCKLADNKEISGHKISTLKKIQDLLKQLPKEDEKDEEIEKEIKEVIEYCDKHRNIRDKLLAHNEYGIVLKEKIDVGLIRESISKINKLIDMLSYKYTGAGQCFNLITARRPEYFMDVFSTGTKFIELMRNFVDSSYGRICVGKENGKPKIEYIKDIKGYHEHILKEILELGLSSSNRLVRSTINLENPITINYTKD